MYSLDPWFFQGKLPVIRSVYEVYIPEYFTFNVDVRGFERIDMKEKSDIQTFRFNFGELTAKSVRKIFTGENIRSLRNEKYIWSPFDFYSAVWFELKATNFPNDFYKPYSNTWDDVDRVICDDSDFGRNIKLNCSFRDELNTLIASAETELQKLNYFISS